MEKKKPNRFLQILLLLFIVFIGLYIASVSGYYESTLNNKVVLTDEAIEKFEEDVLNGEVVDVNSYILEDKKDYQNKFTEAGNKFTEMVESFVTDGIIGVFDCLKTLFYGK